MHTSKRRAVPVNCAELAGLTSEKAEEEEEDETSSNEGEGQRR